MPRQARRRLIASGSPLFQHLSLTTDYNILTGFLETAGFSRAACRDFQLELAADLLASVYTDQRVGDGLEPRRRDFNAAASAGDGGRII